MQNIKRENKKILKLLIIFFMLAVSLSSLANWVGPITNPPLENPKAPINTGSVTQLKQGPLVVNGFRSMSYGIINGDVIIGANDVPDAELDVRGKAKVQNIQITHGAVENYVLRSDSSGNALWTNVADIPGIGGLSEVSWGQINGLLEDQGDLFGELTNIQDSLNLKAPINSPALTGNPTAPTPTSGDNDTSLATTAFVQGALATASSPWARNATSGYVYPVNYVNDKVGLGTNTPTQQLELTGSMLLPKTTGATPYGVIYKGGNRFMHDYGFFSTFLGENAGNFSVSGDGNSGFGYEALKNITTGAFNTATGANTLKALTTGSYNTGVGYNALSAGNGTYNTALGYQTLSSITSGQQNVGMGASALAENSTGSYNVAVGNEALKGAVVDNHTGSNNVAVGYRAGDGNSSGSYNILIGANADVSSSGLNNATAIGSGAVVSASNTMVFGDANVLKWGFGKNVTGDNVFENSKNAAVLTNAGVWQNASDASLKYDVQEISYGLDTLLELRPVDFKWKLNNEQDIGFIAQEVKKIVPEVVAGEDGSMSMSYGQLTAVLTKALQELKAENDLLRERIEKLESAK